MSAVCAAGCQQSRVAVSARGKVLTDGGSSAWGGREGGFGALGWPEHAGFLLEQAGGDQPRGGRVLRWAAESVAGALSARAGERAAQHARGCEVKRLAVVPQTAGDLRVGDDPWSGRERVGVMSRPLQGLPGVGEVSIA
jgi:hypothetical protein